jgi:hypothetical protein
MRALLLPLLLLAVGVANSSQQDLYRWTDNQGVTHYSDQKPIDQMVSPVVLSPIKVIPSQQAAGTLMGQRSETTSTNGSTVAEEADLAALELHATDGSGTPSAPTRHTITLYSWTDEQGVQHYGNDNPRMAPPPAPSSRPSD